MTTHPCTTPAWQPPWLWRALLSVAPAVVAPFCRLHVTGSVPAHLRHGPLLLAANHLSPVDPMILTAACHRARLAPRFLAAAELFRVPLVGAVLRRAGHLSVERTTTGAVDALPAVLGALHDGAPVLLYPEGRIGLDPWMWPERGKTGVARMAAMTGAPVLPVAHWGTHTVMPYAFPRDLARAVWHAMRTRPAVHVHFGEPVDLHGLTGTPGVQAREATRRIMDALDRALAPLRRDEPRTPRHRDPTRPADTRRARPRPSTEPALNTEPVLNTEPPPNTGRGSQRGSAVRSTRT
ncbi:lysophospholipid acyltransferase family protein [Mangrovihabitans endophyticus]|uniref:1-acyl-sn-glycerol-3-phosphate acyltransferase n=1 Tax=Mangrovihabitans endophyticus TaxID=1751298 RepID=A0A8J3FRJ1_9ACTN|nr:lysophospholipid acyltransferase family protein [Mangrovihabitans endophyticus]GGL12170.1 1-acyl-sn-glycerol-3-phosphate acyltransferase [Mangrovihabitans endophyticus]